MESRSELDKLLWHDVGQVILPKLYVADYVSLQRVNSSLYGLFKRKLPPNCWLPQLAYSLAQVPHDGKVRFILQNNLDLLDVVFKEVKLQSRTVTNVTPLQLAYGAYDDVMCATLAPFFKLKYGSLEAGNAEMQRQISELGNIHQEFDFQPIIQAITNEPFNHGYDAVGRWLLSPTTVAVIDQFRKDFAKTQPMIINTGIQFRLETLQALFDAYAESISQWEHDYYKCALLEDAAIAWVLNYLPENIAQSFNQGLWHFQNTNPETFKRMEKTRDGKCFFETLKQQSGLFPLEGACVNIIGGGVRHSMSSGLEPFEMSNLLHDFFQSKTSNLQTLCDPVGVYPNRMM